MKAAAASSALGESVGRWGLPLPQRLLALLRTPAGKRAIKGTRLGLPRLSLAGSDEFYLPWDQREDPKARVLLEEGEKDGEPYPWRNLCAFSAGPYGVREY